MYVIVNREWMNTHSTYMHIECDIIFADYVDFDRPKWKSVCLLRDDASRFRSLSNGKTDWFCVLCLHYRNISAASAMTAAAVAVAAVKLFVFRWYSLQPQLTIYAMVETKVLLFYRIYLCFCVASVQCHYILVTVRLTNTRVQYCTVRALLSPSL